jgi:hypothetical protein
VKATKRGGAALKTLTTTAEKLKDATRPPVYQVAPNLWAPDPAADGIPEMTLARFVEERPGAYRLVPVMENMARVNADLLKKIGMPSQFLTLYRLARAGFIEMIRIAPHTYLLNLDSWYNHVRRCAEDEEFWEKGRGNREEYRKAL